MPSPDQGRCRLFTVRAAEPPHAQRSGCQRESGVRNQALTVASGLIAQPPLPARLYRDRRPELLRCGKRVPSHAPASQTERLTNQPKEGGIL